jgi:hypothetical protein
VEENKTDRKPVLPLKVYAERQVEEMLGDVNLYYAGKELGRPPTKEDLEKWYVEHGGPENFAQRFINAGLVSGAGDKKEGEKETLNEQ